MMKRLHVTSTVALALALFALAFAATATSVRAEFTKRDADALAKTTKIFVATVRKDGNQSRAGEVWFTTGADGTVLIQTSPSTWKAKRIGRGSPAIVWIGAENGPAFIGYAEITKDAAAIQKILDDFRERYLMNRIGGVGPSRAKFDHGRVIAIKITPVRDLPDGFESEPGKLAPKIENVSSTAESE
jgi:general stress protein 26